MDRELGVPAPGEIDLGWCDVPRRGTVVARAGDIRPRCLVMDGPGAVWGLVPDGDIRGKIVDWEHTEREDMAG